MVQSQNQNSGSPPPSTTSSEHRQSEHPQANAVISSRHLQSEQAKGKTINVILFGETGVGKSSVINLIARKNVAKVSSDVNGCTMQSTQYDIDFDGMNFAIFDTIGLEEPQMGVNGYLTAIEKAYELILKLGDAGGIHLLLFCMRGGRITATTQSNYRLFCECLCSSVVPVALVFTGLEREVQLDDWWSRNKTHIERYGIKSTGHACVTAVQDEELGEDIKFKESQDIIRNLLKNCALKSGAYQLDSSSWFAKFGRGLLSFIEKAKIPKKKDVMKTLTDRCKLDPETAKKIVDMIHSSDQQRGAEVPQIADARPAAQKEVPQMTDVRPAVQGDVTQNADVPPTVQEELPQTAAAPPAAQKEVTKIADVRPTVQEESPTAIPDGASVPADATRVTEANVVEDRADSLAGVSDGGSVQRTDSRRTEPGKEKKGKTPRWMLNKIFKSTQKSQTNLQGSSRRNGGAETPKPGGTVSVGGQG